MSGSVLAKSQEHIFPAENLHISGRQMQLYRPAP